MSNLRKDQKKLAAIQLQKTRDLEKKNQEMIRLRNKIIDEAVIHIRAVKEAFVVLVNKKIEYQEVDQDLEELATMRLNMLLRAQSYYRNNLQCYVELDNDDWRIHTFYFLVSDQEAPRKDRYVRLKHCNKQWTLLSMFPMLPSFELLQKRLGDTNDIQGFLAHIHKSFRKIDGFL